MLTWRNWEMVDNLMMLVSLGVIALMIAAMPWAGAYGTDPSRGFPCRNAPRTPATA